MQMAQVTMLFLFLETANRAAADDSEEAWCFRSSFQKAVEMAAQSRVPSKGMDDVKVPYSM